MKILVDECLAPSWPEFLVEAGFEAVHWIGIGKRGEDDLEILEWAEANDHVILIRDLDFSSLLTWHGQTKPSVIQLRTGDSLPDKGTGELVANIIRSAAEALEEGAIVTIEVEKKKARIKRLLEW